MGGLNLDRFRTPSGRQVDRSRGIPKAFPMHSQCIPRHSQCIPEAFPRHSQGIPNAFPRHVFGAPGSLSAQVVVGWPSAVDLVCGDFSCAAGGEGDPGLWALWVQWDAVGLWALWSAVGGVVL